jgi:heterodisulfide reductase subunit C
LLAGIGYFSWSIRRIRRNILLGKDIIPLGNVNERIKTMLQVAIGQSKMVKRRTLAGIFHVMIYVGFIVINIEVIEIIIDGLAGTHRLFGPALGIAYNGIIAIAELFMLLVFVACVVFLLRRNVAKVPRFRHPEMKGWPKVDADVILWTEMALVAALWVMNAADQNLQAMDAAHYAEVGSFPISSWLAPAFEGLSKGTLVTIERSAWWVHIIGILAFLNYIPYSKHLHIFLSFPNVYFTEQKSKGAFDVDQRVAKEVKLMMDPNAEMPAEEEEETGRFGAKDVFDLKWTNLLNAYTCTECGRCSDVCPANMTGKKLSPRKVMMDTRDRLYEVGLNMEQNKGEFQDDGKSLHDYITGEELWACTTCNACVEACPVNINPLDIIVQMRQYLVMEQSQASEQLNAMFMNVENNQAPWAFPAADRFKWAEGLSIKTGGNGDAGAAPSQNEPEPANS